jgi:predicted PurR-regulated permease PerM
MAARRGGGSPVGASGPAPPADPAPGGPQVERIRGGGRTIVGVVAVVIGASVVVNVVSSATRVLGWLLAAILLAGLLDPVVQRVGRVIPRGFSVLVVLLALIGLAAVAGYGLIDQLGREVHRLERAAPDAARNIEESRRFGSAAREFKLAERTQRFVDELPQRLQGGSGADLLRTNATRSVAYLAGGVLTAFLLLHGHRLVESGLAQIDDERRRRRVTRVLDRGYRRARAYAAGRFAFSIGTAIVVGTAGWVADVPGYRVLGLFAAVWSLVPTVGLFIGSLPIVALAGGTPGGTSAMWMLTFFAVLQVAEALAFRRFVERRSLRVGPFVSLLAGMVGFELYGIGGAIATLALAAFALGVADELAPTDEDEVDLSAIVG